MISLIVSIIALGAIIAFHEAGHFFAARLFGVGIIEFSIGMGPRILSAVRKNTRYSLRVFPFGGSCMMLGEDMGEDDYDDDGTAGESLYSDAPGFPGPDTRNHGPVDISPVPGDTAGRKKLLNAGITNGSFDESVYEYGSGSIVVDGRSFSRDEQFTSKPAWQRFIIIAAGPFFNFILAFLMALVITSAYGYDRPIVRNVEEGTPLSETGISAGDRITGLAVLSDRTKPAGIERIRTSRDVQIFMYMASESLEQQDIFVIRYADAETGLEADAAASPFYDSTEERYRLGFSYSVSYAPADGLADIIGYSLYDVAYCIRSALLSLKLIIRGRVGSSDVMGPVRMVATMDEAVDEAADYSIVAALMTLINLMILISGSLGAANLLPIPALDGGRLVFIIIEMITRRPVPAEIEGRIHMAGMMVLLTVMLLIFFNDILLLLTGG